MPNTSATGGYLPALPTPAPLEDTALLNFVQEWIVGISGLLGSNVRPRWQPEPPNIPKDGTDWAAFGITKREADTFAVELHSPIDPGYNETRRHEILHFLVSFYGPNAGTFAGVLRDGMQVAQNREVLNLNNMGLVESGDITPAPELIKEKWLYRLDLPFSIRRQVVRRYGVLNLAAAQGTLNNEHYIEPITT